MIEAMAVSYCVGSIPFGYLLARAFYGVDVRQHGSGNVGATNVTRLTGRALGVVTLLLDVAKAYLVVRYYGNADELQTMAAMVMVTVGHMFPVWLFGRGGKGVAVLLGIVLALQTHLMIVLIIVWGAVFLVSGYVSLASILMVTSVPFVWSWHPNDNVAYAIVVVCLMIVLAHHRNVIALWRGTEYRFRR